MGMKGSSSKSRDWRGEEGAGILPRNSTQMWKKAREIGEKRRRVRVVRLGEVNSRLGKVGVWEKKMEKILDRILKGKETFPPI